MQNFQNSSSSKGKEKETGHTKESITTPMKKGSISDSNLMEFVGAQGVACFDLMRLLVRGDQPIEEEIIPMSIDNWGKEYSDRVGKENIIEIIRHEWLSASTLTLYIR